VRIVPMRCSCIELCIKLTNVFRIGSISWFISLSWWNRSFQQSARYTRKTFHEWIFQQWMIFIDWLIVVVFMYFCRRRTDRYNLWTINPRECSYLTRTHHGTMTIYRSKQRSNTNWKKSMNKSMTSIDSIRHEFDKLQLETRKVNLT
jgi:hypothetical protein